MERKKSLKESRRDQILDAAVKCFSEKGYRDARIEEIIAEAGMSKGGVYWHFSGKKEIFLASQDRWRQQTLEALNSGLEDPGLSMNEALERSFDKIIRYFCENRLFLLAWIEFASAAARDEEIRNSLIEIKRKYQETLTAQLEGLVKRGEIKPINIPAMANLLSILHDGILINSVIWPEKYSRKEVHEEISALLIELAKKE